MSLPHAVDPRYRQTENGLTFDHPESGLDVESIKNEETLLILYETDATDPSFSVLHGHGRETDVMTAWRTMWPALTRGRITQGRQESSRFWALRLRVESITPSMLSEINAALLGDLRPDIICRSVERAAM